MSGQRAAATEPGDGAARGRPGGRARDGAKQRTAGTSAETNRRTQRARKAAATLVDVARLAGVSRATAARALGDYGAVSDGVRERVRVAAAELGYRANTVARSVRTGRTSTIGCVVADMRNPFFAATTRGISDAATQHGYRVIVVNTDEDLPTEERAIDLLLQQRVSGVILASRAVELPDYLDAAHRDGYPFVLLDRKIRGLDIDSVMADNRSGATQALRSLVALGHRRIGFISAAPPDSLGPRGGLGGIVTSGRARAMAYRATMESLLGAADRDRYLRLAGYAEGAAAAAANELLERPDRPTALFASDSVVAIEVLTAIREAGLRVPEDLSVLMGDDVPWALATTPATAAISQPAYEQGVQAVELLLRRLREPAAPIRNVVLGVEFHSRPSIGPAPN